MLLITSVQRGFWLPILGVFSEFLGILHFEIFGVQFLLCFQTFWEVISKFRRDRTVPLACLRILGVLRGFLRRYSGVLLGHHH